jgi:hypothetical protein
MTTTYSVQRYIWNDGRWEGFEPIVQVRAMAPTEAVERAMGEPMADAGPISQVALKVWETGGAKRPCDVRHYWRRP